jgi:hypothetical protein
MFDNNRSGKSVIHTVQIYYSNAFFPVLRISLLDLLGTQIKLPWLFASTLRVDSVTDSMLNEQFSVRPGCSIASARNSTLRVFWGEDVTGKGHKT